MNKSVDYKIIVAIIFLVVLTIGGIFYQQKPKALRVAFPAAINDVISKRTSYAMFAGDIFNRKTSMDASTVYEFAVDNQGLYHSGAAVFYILGQPEVHILSNQQKESVIKSVCNVSEYVIDRLDLDVRDHTIQSFMILANSKCKFISVSYSDKCFLKFFMDANGKFTELKIESNTNNKHAWEAPQKFLDELNAQQI